MKFLLLAITAISSLAFSQQKMTLEDCEDAFQKNNLQLVAQKYNISMAEADIVQAKIWDQPSLNFGGAVHTPQNNRWFDLPHTSTATVQQLFLLGGKRRKQVDLLSTNRDINRYQFTQMLFDLTAQLRENFYQLYFEQQKISKLDVEIGYLEDLMKAYKTQNKLGNISLKDVVTIQNMLMNLYGTKQQLNNNVLNYRQNLKVLTSLDVDIIAVMPGNTEQDLLARTPPYSAEEIKQKAVENNAAYLASQKQIESSEKNLAYQKSLNIPDLTAGVTFSKIGNSSVNETDFGLGIPLPLWSKNKGNIERAEYGIQQSRTNAELQRITTATQAQQNFNTWQAQYKQYNAFKNEDYKNMDIIYEGMKKNFRLGNITLTDFTVFMDSYNQSMLQLIELKKQILIAGEEINHITQTNIFNP